MVIEIPLSKASKKNAGKYIAIVDDCDEELAELNWQVSTTHRGYSLYAQRRHFANGVFLANQKMHRVILAKMLNIELLPSNLVDHINGNGLDNRRENLRLATVSQNQMNKSVQNNNKAGYKGVSPYKAKFRADIYINRVHFYLGVFDTPEEAHAAYCVKALELHGKFVKLK